MEISERVTWEVCPTCGRTAAVGWLHGRMVEFDCTAGCRLTAAQADLFADRRHPVAGWLTEPTD